MIGKYTRIAFMTLAVTASAASSPFVTEKQPQTSNTRKAKMISKLVGNARPTENSQLGRRLEQGEPDLSSYEIKFDQCQFVQGYDDELAEDEEADSVLGVKHFIIFRLCPSGSCSSCSYNYGEYIIDMESYLEAATEFFAQDREDQCELCNEICEADDYYTKNLGLVDCDTCYSYCASLENMNDNGYMESYEFTECMQVYESDDGSSQIFSGAICSNNGKSIKIGAFSDEDCLTRKSGIDIENYLENGASFNNEILEMVTDSSSCVSCVKTDYEVPDQNENNNNNNNNNNQQEEVELNEMCQELYEMSAKCETKYGFDNYWKYYEDYSNQYIQEDLVCDFISSMKNGNYDEYGEIVISGSKSSGSTGATGGQKFALTFFILSTVGLGVYAASLHNNLTKGGKPDLSTQGGAMA